MEKKSWWRKFNPRLIDFMEKKPHLSLLGLWWAMQWRITVFMWVISIIVFILSVFVGATIFNSLAN